MPQRPGDSWADQEAAFFGAATGGAGGIGCGSSGSSGSNKRRPQRQPIRQTPPSSVPPNIPAVVVPDRVRETASALRDSALTAGRTLRREVGDALRSTERHWREGGGGGGGGGAFSSAATATATSAYPGNRRPGGSGGNGHVYGDVVCVLPPPRASHYGRPAPPPPQPPPASSSSPPPQPPQHPTAGSFLPTSLRGLTRQISRHAGSVVPSCVVCGALARPGTRYQFHPFFPEEKACASHGNADGRGGGGGGSGGDSDSVGRCSGCNRFEPWPGSTDASRQFADLHDRGRKLCPACLRTVVTDSDEGRTLWFEVLRWLEEEHGLLSNGNSGSGGGGSSRGGGGSKVRKAMESIPVLIVEHDALNDPGVRGSGHGPGFENDMNGISHTRGLCVYEYTTHPLGGQLRDFLSSSGLGGVGSSSAAAAASLLTSKARITAVLCLRGLPRDLAASVLAHEATHAWFKLHPSYDPRVSLPRMVEEGCCQLVAYLYLRHLEDREGGTAASSSGNDRGDDEDGPSDARLRQYFRYSIETMTDPVYGDGFRSAAAAYAAGGSSLSSLLAFVVENGGFPPPPTS